MHRVALLAWIAIAACASDAGAPGRAVRPVELRAEPALAPIVAEAPSARPALAPYPVKVLEGAPRGERVALGEPVVVRFDHAVEPAMVERAFVVEPPVVGRFVWRDAATVAFEHEPFAQGREYTVRVGGVAPDGGVVMGERWTFRSRVPAPARIEPGRGGNVIFTFDDGASSPKQADRLLALLAELRIRALFFPTGKWTERHPDFIPRAVEAGHRVCNHTYSHVNLSKAWMTEARIRDEIARGADDGGCRLFRPPFMGYGEREERIARSLGYDLFLWDIDSRDWEGGPAEDLENLVLGRVRPGAVVLMHVHARATLAALPPLAAKLRETGYVLSWDPADLAPNVGEGATGEVNKPPAVLVEGKWLTARAGWSDSDALRFGREGAPLLDSE